MQLALPLAADEPAPRLIRHRRARRYILRVLEDGTVRVTMPKWGTLREAMQFVEAHRGWVQDQQARRQQRASERPAYLSDPAFLGLAERYGITVTRVLVRNQRSRWGSCSRRGTITLNWRLVLVPDFVREYVMLHELMHRRELNHSARFWRLVADVCPRMDEAVRWLRIDGARLF
jgi:predicted metal-dependent hydrolase